MFATSMSCQAHSIDAFHRGNFLLVQPRAGHRAGIDAMLLAACVPGDFSGQLADFGSGAGGAGLAVLSRVPGATATLVEQSAEMFGFAALTLDHPANAHLRQRASLLKADVALSGRDRESAGLSRHSFDFVIMNPPFNLPADRASPDGLKRKAHVMEDGLFERWMRSAAAVLRPRGRVAAIARPVSLPAMLAAMSSRFGDTEIVPVHARAHQKAIRVVLRARLGSRGGLSLCPPFILHGPTGEGFTRRADDVNNGKASLFGD
jgi:tRNA1(Val) A37 N6-methylase TrmN6